MFKIFFKEYLPVEIVVENQVKEIETNEEDTTYILSSKKSSLQSKLLEQIQSKAKECNFLCPWSGCRKTFVQKSSVNMHIRNRCFFNYYNPSTYQTYHTLAMHFIT